MYNNQNSNPFGILNGRKPVQQAQGGLQVQTPQSQVQPDQPGAMSKVGNYAMNKGMDSAWKKGVEMYNTPAPITDPLLTPNVASTQSIGPLTEGQAAVEGFGQTTMVNGIPVVEQSTMGLEALAPTVAPEVAATVAPEVAAALAPAAATTTAVGTGTALAGGATAAGAMFPPLLIGGLILSSMFS